MEKLMVRAIDHSYSISIAKGLRHQSGSFLNKDYTQVAIITDSNVKSLYLEDVKQSINLDVVTYVIPSGEDSKSLKVYEDVQKFLLSNHFDRHSVIIALGGGVVGDLAGFVAATYMRGIDFIQIPTTLLAHDSSVGGKVGINLSHTKNILGSFYPPQRVIYDTEMLDTLNEQEIRSGFAEMVKHGFISNKNLLQEFKKISQINPKHSHFDQWLYESLKVKTLFVEQDELESDIRRYLNFGHTLGHAVEVSKNDTTHGECVMLGMLFALYLSDQVNNTTDKLFNKELINWLAKLKYPLNLMNDVKLNTLIDKMVNDKKNSNQLINFVLLKNLEEPYMASFTKAEIEKHLKTFKDLKVLKDV